MVAARELLSVAVFQVEAGLGGPGGQEAGCKPTVNAWSLENQLYQHRGDSRAGRGLSPFALPCEALSRILHPGMGPPSEEVCSIFGMCPKKGH